MFEELPEGFHKQEGLKYLVRRIDGQEHPDLLINQLPQLLGQA